ncbi:MAG TPA: RNA polymerase sigma factor [Polyangia bacterium]|jgi:RNA polymerase sigma-70 factor (ECF subfamily)|nr:RNA polymerase sigma factor [Polyangia bacterium]
MTPPVNKVILTVEKMAAVGEPPAAEVTRLLTFEEIYSQWFHDVSRWVRALGGMNADLDDLTQEVFLVVRRKLSRFDGRNLAGWLYSIAKHQVRDYRRRAWVRRFVKGPEREPEINNDSPIFLVQPTPDPGEALQRKEVERFLTQTLAKMSEMQRTAFVLFEIEGYSGEEIAELEQIPVNTVWTRLHHARKRFFELVDEARVEGRLP